MAVAVSDKDVCSALLHSGCGECIASLLDSNNGGLIHRALVFAIEFVSLGGLVARDHLGERGVVTALSTMLKNNKQNPQLMELGRSLAEAMNSVSTDGGA